MKKTLAASYAQHTAAVVAWLHRVEELNLDVEGCLETVGSEWDQEDDELLDDEELEDLEDDANQEFYDLNELHLNKLEGGL